MNERWGVTGLAGLAGTGGEPWNEPPVIASCAPCKVLWRRGRREASPSFEDISSVFSCTKLPDKSELVTPSSSLGVNNFASSRDNRGFTISKDTPLNRTEGLSSRESTTAKSWTDDGNGCALAKFASTIGGCGNGYLDKENVEVLAVLVSDKYKPSALFVVKRNGAGLRFSGAFGRGRRLIVLKCLEVSVIVFFA